MTLGELILALKQLNPDAVVTHGFDKPRSYRGYYDQLAFEPKKHARIGNMLAHAESALGGNFQGYKGGWYKMHVHTDCWISEYGTCSNDGISSQLVAYWKAEADKA
jgi:hypothetical protein